MSELRDQILAFLKGHPFEYTKHQVQLGLNVGYWPLGRELSRLRTEGLVVNRVMESSSTPSGKCRCLALKEEAA